MAIYIHALPRHLRVARRDVARGARALDTARVRRAALHRGHVRIQIVGEGREEHVADRRRAVLGRKAPVEHLAREEAVVLRRRVLSRRPCVSCFGSSHFIWLSCLSFSTFALPEPPRLFSEMAAERAWNRCAARTFARELTRVRAMIPTP